MKLIAKNKDRGRASNIISTYGRSTIRNSSNEERSNSIPTQQIIKFLKSRRRNLSEVSKHSLKLRPSSRQIRQDDIENERTLKSKLSNDNSITRTCTITKNTNSKVLKSFVNAWKRKSPFEKRNLFDSHSNKILESNNVHRSKTDIVASGRRTGEESILSCTDNFSKTINIEKLKDVFEDQNIKIDNFVDIVREKFILAKDDAILLAKYIFNLNSESHSEMCLEVSSDHIEQKLRDLTSINDKINKDYLKIVISKIVENLSSEELKLFLYNLQNLQKSDSVIPYEFIKIMYNLPLKNFKIEIDTLIILLFRKSKSLRKIKSSVIKTEITDIIRSMIRAKFRSKTLKTNKSLVRYQNNNEYIQREQPSKINSIHSEHNMEIFEEQQSYQKAEYLLNQIQMNDDKSFKIKDSIIHLCEQIYSNKKTISDIIGPKIFDQVIDGKEYQLIRRGDFIKSLENEGIQLTIQEINLLKDVIKPIWTDAIDVNNLEEITKNFGIYEDYPTDNKHLDYSSLTGPSIRTFNKIIKYMNENYISNILSMIPKNKIEKITLVSKTKEETIDYITPSSFEEVLRNKNILKRSENLEQEIIDFTEINQNYENMIMIRKLKRCIVDIKNSKYFQKFGVCQRKILQNDVQSLIKKAATFIPKSDFSAEVDRSISKAAAKVDVKVQKSLANILLLKWKALMIKGSDYLKVKDQNKSIDDLASQFSDYKQSNMKNSEETYYKFNVENPKSCDKNDNNMGASMLSSRSDVFNNSKMNREMMRKKFGLASKINICY